MGDWTGGRDRRPGQGVGRTGVTVSGSGSAAAAVDQVTVTLAVTVTRADAGEAFESAALTVTRVLAILADDGADSRSVRTTDVTLGPRVRFQQDRDVVLGYDAGQRLIVQLPGPAGVERLLSDVAVGGGEGVRIESVTLTASDPRSALQEARAAAFADALAKATQLAELAGRAMGPLRCIDELPDGRRDTAIPLRLARGASATMPIAAGDASVGVSVAAQWDFAAESD